MEISIKESIQMDLKESIFLESKTIRIPEDYRNFCDFKLGEFISIRTKEKGLVSLQVDKAYKEDAFKDSMSAYVTKDTYKLLGIESNSKEIDIVDDITLGADPEFFLIDIPSKNIIHPSAFFKKWGMLGFDGLLAEIRPMPSVSADVVTSNIFGLLRQAREATSNKHNNVMLKSGSHLQGLTAGFHLHFGLPREILNYKERARILAPIAVKVLDYYVGVPCVIQEGIEESQRRCSAFLPYGKAGDYRIDTRTLEYRVPGGVMLKHPILTKGLLSLGSLVVEDIISRLKHCTNNFDDISEVYHPNFVFELYPDLPNTFAIYKLICVPDPSLAINNLDTILKGLSNMVGFKRRKDDIEMLFNHINQKFSDDLTYNWQLVNTNEQRRVKHAQFA